ncbi:diacylglycerol/lipid kinase family protein [Coralliovum pocilloporae]|uniref:diacylglycerol/lipid kinase family protein n=1 Tax=Coralliovum pocilloporae TaxID=3066369 RepID=UPI003307C224
MDGQVSHPAIRTLTILANPVAGGYSPRRMRKYVNALAQQGIATQVRLTGSADDIVAYCADSSEQPDAIAVAGGDGTLVQAVRGLRQRPDPCPPLAVIPFGTANVLALSLGLGFSARSFADMIAGNRRVPVYTGRRNGDVFILMVSSGFDAQVVHALPLGLKRRLGKLAYGLTAIRQAFRRKRDVITVTVDGLTYEGRLAVITNTPHYGGPMVICPEASALKPGLHLVLLEKDSTLFLIRCAINLLRNRLADTPGVTILPCEAAELTSSSGAPLQSDGDAAGYTPVLLEADNEPVMMVVR